MKVYRFHFTPKKNLSEERLKGVRAPKELSFLSGGDEEIRTPDPLRAKQVLSQLSYTPILN